VTYGRRGKISTRARFYKSYRSQEEEEGVRGISGRLKKKRGGKKKRSGGEEKTLQRKRRLRLTKKGKKKRQSVELQKGSTQPRTPSKVPKED